MISIKPINARLTAQKWRKNVYFINVFVIVFPSTLEERSSSLSAFLTRNGMRHAWNTAMERMISVVDLVPWAEAGSEKSGSVEIDVDEVRATVDLFAWCRSPVGWSIKLLAARLLAFFEVEETSERIVVMLALWRRWCCCRATMMREWLVMEYINWWWCSVGWCWCVGVDAERDVVEKWEEKLLQRRAERWADVVCNRLINCSVGVSKELGGSGVRCHEEIQSWAVSVDSVGLTRWACRSALDRWLWKRDRQLRRSWLERLVVLDTRSLLFVRSKFFFSSVTRRRNEGALLKIH